MTAAIDRETATSSNATTPSGASASFTARWRERYAARLWITDFVALIWVVYGAQIVWLGITPPEVAIRSEGGLGELSYWLFSAILVVLWMWALSLRGSRDYRVIGTGTTEYIRVADASLRLFGAVAIIAFVVQLDVARGYLLIALPAGIVVLALERWLWRLWLNAHRRSGDYSARVLLVGSRASVAQVARELARNRNAGYHLVGACVPSGTVAETIPGTEIPIMGNVDTIQRALEVTAADTVAVTSTDELPPDKVKRISWDLESGRQHLVLAPSILDIAGPRIHTRPVSGLPLIHVETPRFTRGQLLGKRALDVVASSLLILVSSLLLICLAIAVKTTSEGPAFFRQTRVGLGGRTFSMIKFRSMVVDAEHRLTELQRQRREEGFDSGNEVLFKMTNDPRVTGVGRVMRKYSLDELPQLFNVLRGSMSLVGPRPSLPREVAEYDDHVHRRFLVKPGITGLWQVSGRSSLSWEESVRLDLSYVENWSILTDLVILARTAKAAFAPGTTAS